MWGWDNLISFVGGLGATSLMFWQASGKLAEKFIDKKMAIKLKDHEAELNNLAAEKARAHELRLQAVNHEFDKKIHDFSLYSKRRHEIYPEVYSLLLKASYPIALPSEKTFNLNESNSDSVRAYFKDKVPNFVIDELLRIKKEQPLRYNKELDELRRTTHYHIQYNDWVRANKLLLSSELFFESDTFKSASAISDAVHNILAIQEQRMYGRWDKGMYQEQRAAMDRIKENITLLKDLMKRDMNQES